MGNVVSIGGAREAPKSVQSRMETLIIGPAMVNAWKVPPFQRPLRVNEKVRLVTEQIKKTETIEGVLTLGKLKGDPAFYIVDGQHRAVPDGNSIRHAACTILVGTARFFL